MSTTSQAKQKKQDQLRGYRSGDDVELDLDSVWYLIDTHQTPPDMLQVTVTGVTTDGLAPGISPVGFKGRCGKKFELELQDIKQLVFGDWQNARLARVAIGLSQITALGSMLTNEMAELRQKLSR